MSHNTEAGLTAEAARPLKRQRTDESIDPLAATTCTRDSDFYPESPAFASADCCILRVEGVLFKVQRSLLMRDSAVFDTMFGLPQGELPSEGTSDDDPIVIEGDKSDDFRSLLKYLTKPGFDLIPQEIPLNDVHNIIALGKMAHKYQMDGWQKWASLVLLEIVSKHQAALSPQDVVSVFELGMLFSNEDLLRKVVDAWMERIKRGDLPSSDAMDVAERHNRRPFLAMLYEHELTKLPRKMTDLPFSQPAAFTTLQAFRPIHVQRILSAHTSLSISWSAFRQLKLTVPGPSLCLPRQRHCDSDMHQRLCVPNFESQWMRATNSAEELFPLTKIRDRVTHVQLRMLEKEGNDTSDPVAPVSFYAFGSHSQQVSALGSCRFVSSGKTDPIRRVLAAAPKTLEAHFFAADLSSA
ncbi:hypothetical protein C8F01DRAFT_1366550 [Mycena amicta]|nr:hypothetical protein C8F01DRAFT_1366550 [Mycena amicta]